MAEQEEKQAIPNLSQVFGEANQAIMESIIAAQQRNMKFTQDVFTSAMEVLKSHAQSTHDLMQQLEQLAHKQQEALQKQAPGTGWNLWMQQSYMEPLRIGLSSYQQALNAAEQATQQQLERFEKASKDFEHAQQRLRATSESTSR